MATLISQDGNGTGFGGLVYVSRAMCSFARKSSEQIAGQNRPRVNRDAGQ